jgi:hypothetical protein
MSIEQIDVVDLVGIEYTTGRATLTITDHLDWSENEGEHLLMLQEKLNAYFRFIESGEMEERIPATRGRSVLIRICAKYPPSPQASKFFGLVKNFIEEAGFDFEFQVMSE